MFEVVEDEEHLSLLEKRAQAIDRRRIIGVGEPEYLGNRDGDEGWIPQWSERHEGDTVREVAAHFGRDLQCEP